jgi:Arc/MetJ-type ribon-helix-helix transcriptional regulator
MKSVALKIPESIDAKIRSAVARRAESFSDLARRALAREVEEHKVDFARLAVLRDLQRPARSFEPRGLWK